MLSFIKLVFYFKQKNNYIDPMLRKTTIGKWHKLVEWWRVMKWNVETIKMKECRAGDQGLFKYENANDLKTLQTGDGIL